MRHLARLHACYAQLLLLLLLLLLLHAAYELYIVCLSNKPFSDGEINTIYDNALLFGQI